MLADDRIYNLLPFDNRDAFYQLVLFPVKASLNLNELWVTVGKNRLYAKQGRVSTNDLEKNARVLFTKDSTLLLHYYNKILSDGKWNHMMDQIHISLYLLATTSKRRTPEVRKIEIPDAAAMVLGSKALKIGGHLKIRTPAAIP